MLKRFRVNNFRSLLNVEFRPVGVNVLIGPNNAGKTNLCSALRFLGLTASQSLEDDGGAVSQTRGGQGPRRQAHPPETVSARIHAMTRMPAFRDEGHLRSDYFDIDDFSLMHVVFEDGTVATIFASDIILGGIHNWLEVAANNHRTFFNINPNTAMQTYNPVDANFKDIYVVEKIGTKQGWTYPSPDEDWFRLPAGDRGVLPTVAYGKPVESDSRLAADASRPFTAPTSRPSQRRGSPGQNLGENGHHRTNEPI